jgi:hypothetical protein
MHPVLIGLDVIEAIHKGFFVSTLRMRSSQELIVLGDVGSGEELNA